MKSVEVITNPPAKYEASGSAVLNIVLKQNKLEGYRGYISGKYVQSIYPKGVGTIAQYYKRAKFRLWPVIPMEPSLLSGGVQLYLLSGRSDYMAWYYEPEGY